jgi:hypothetical protein
MPMMSRRSAGLAVVSLFSLAWACSDGGTPKAGKGDTLIVDVDATNQPPPPMPDAGDDSPYGTYEDGGGAYGYSPLSVCKKCACEAGTYCFGGGTGHTTFSGTCSGASGLAVGCQPMPAGCASTTTCASADCIFMALKPELSCYPECVQGEAPIVYCMNP